MGDEIALMAVMRLDVRAQLPVSLCWEMFPSVWENLNVCMPWTTACSSDAHFLYYHQNLTIKTTWTCRATYLGELQSLGGGYVLDLSVKLVLLLVVISVSKRLSQGLKSCLCTFDYVHAVYNCWLINHECFYFTAEARCSKYL